MNGKFAKSEISLLYATDRSKAVVPELFLFCVALRFILGGASCSVLHCSSFSYFFSHFSIVITLLGEERAVLNLNIHTSYFSHVWTIRTNTACEEFARIRHRFPTHLSHTCDIYVLYQLYRWHECEFFKLLEIPLNCLSVTYDFFTCIS